MIDKKTYRKILLVMLYCTGSAGFFAILACVLAPRYGITSLTPLATLPSVFVGIIIVLLTALGVSYLPLPVLPAPDGKKLPDDKNDSGDNKDADPSVGNIRVNKPEPDKRANDKAKPNDKPSHGTDSIGQGQINDNRRTRKRQRKGN